MIEIKEFKEIKQKLDNDLSRVIGDLIIQFREDTGITVKRVDVYTEREEYSDGSHRVTIHGVHTELDI